MIVESERYKIVNFLFTSNIRESALLYASGSYSTTHAYLYIELEEQDGGHG